LTFLYLSPWYEISAWLRELQSFANIRKHIERIKCWLLFVLNLFVNKNIRFYSFVRSPSNKWSYNWISRNCLLDIFSDGLINTMGTQHNTHITLHWTKRQKWFPNSHVYYLNYPNRYTRTHERD
jgi:hypothetical protein